MKKKHSLQNHQKREERSEGGKRKEWIQMKDGYKRKEGMEGRWWRKKN